MLSEGKIWLAQSDKNLFLLPRMANRHGLIAGATGTGKTVTMKVMAEAFSDAGVPVFLCDVKGDVSGLAVPGDDSEGMRKRIEKFGIRDSFSYHGYPVCFWDIYARGGHPVRTTVSDMGPEILARIMGLTEIQEGVLNIIFRIADEHGMAILDLKDLQARVEPGAFIREQVDIGRNAVIMMGAVINIGAVIGDGTMIDMGAVIGGRAEVGRNCHIGAGAVLAGVVEPASAVPVIVEDDVLVGANAVLIEGVHIGKGAVIAAGAVVTCDVPANMVAAGCPARIIKEKDERTSIRTALEPELRHL